MRPTSRLPVIRARRTLPKRPTYERLGRVSSIRKKSMEKRTRARKKQAAGQSQAGDHVTSRKGGAAESQSDYREIFHAVDAAILIHDIETGAVLDANRKACEIYGGNVEEIRQLIPESWSSGDPPYTTEAALARIE